MKWARIYKGEVAELTDRSPAGRYHPDLVWVECPLDCEAGWSYDGETFFAPTSILESDIGPSLVYEVGAEEMQILLSLGYTQKQIETEILGVWSYADLNSILAKNVD